MSALAKSASAVILSVVIGWHLIGLRCILDPPAIPKVVGDSGRAPGRKIWVSLNTNRPECFCVRLNSIDYFNRKANVVWKSETWPRAELILLPRPGHTNGTLGRVEIIQVKKFELWGILAEERVGDRDLQLLEIKEGGNHAK